VSPTFLVRRGWAELRNEVLVLPSRTIALAWAVAVLLLPVVWPDPYVLRVAAMTCIFATLAASWDLLAGYTGQVSFGHALFFGAGAYASALASQRLGLSPWITIWIGAAVATLVGFASGYLCLRLRGAYLSLATLAFPLIALGILFAFPDVSGGELGISGLRTLARSRTASYYVAAITTLVLVFGMWLFADSKLGLVLHAIRDDEVAARASGIDTIRYKLSVFAISAFAAGLSGAVYAHFLRVAGPSTLETALSFQVVIWGIFGGLATVYGPVTAVCVLYPLTEWMGTYESFAQVRLLVFALIVLVVLLFMPRGLTPWIRDRIETQCPRCKQRNVAWRSECRLCGAALREATARRPAPAAARPDRAASYSPR
jgi:branched-chain amino acid transport system permease protein